MPQVEENIGGRQDQKNNSLRTKTLAVGLLVVVGCFVVGVFRATTTTTTTAQARDVSSSPNVDGMVVLPAEAAEGTWWSNSVFSSSSGRQRRVVGAGRAAAEEGIIVTQDGHYSTTRSRRYDFAAAVAAGTGAVVTEDGTSTYEVPPRRKAAVVAAGKGAVVTEDGTSTYEVPPHRVTHKYGKKTTQPSVAVLSSGREILMYCHDVDDNWVPTQCNKGDKCPGYPTDLEKKRGMCDTSGIYDHVLPYLNHKEVIPGKIYYGLKFTDWRYEGETYTPHNPQNLFHKNQSCKWGGGESVGRCMRQGGGLPNAGDFPCPSTQRKIVNAWQQCAEMCNDEPSCHTFTVTTQALFHHRDFHCYFHKSYECKKENNKSAGIDNYVHHEDILRDANYDDLGVWSGICRTKSGRTNDYACTNTPIPCGNCANSQPCCRDGGAFDFSCPGCGNGRI